MEMRLLVIGDEDAVLGFSLVGVDGYSTTDPQDAQRKLDEVMQSRDTGLVLLTETLAQKLRTHVDNLRFGKALPLILEVPDGQTTLEVDAMRALVRRVLGISI